MAATATRDDRPTVRTLLADAGARLTRAGITTARLDAQVLLAHVLGRDRAYLMAHPELQPPGPARLRFQRLLSRRESREPVAYLTGWKEFSGIKLKVTPWVLVPRPETETLVERAISCLRSDARRRAAIDVGTGSGAIAMALAAHCRRLKVDAVDLSPRALAVARANARLLGLEKRVRVRRANLLEGAHPADLVVANLPYLSSFQMRRLPPEVRLEPKMALHGGPDGLRLIRRLVAQAAHVLRSDGCLLLECDPAQAASIAGLCRTSFPGATVEIIRDLSGRQRVVEVHS
jgi:release factor glutamine methyltransferase